MKFNQLPVCMAVAACLLSTGLFGQANAIDTYFKQYVDDERFSVVYISPKIFQMIDKLDLDEVELDGESSTLIKDVAKDLRGLRILSIDEDGDRYYEEAKSKIDQDIYESLLTVRQKGGGNVDFMVKENAEGIIEELLLLAGGDGDFALLSFVGTIDLEKVAKLAKEMEKDKEKGKVREQE